MYQFIINNSLGRHLGCVLFFAALSVSTLSNAQYQDPLDTPAIHLPMAKYALLLDVTDTGKRLVAVGERGHILYSTDAGINWQQAQVPVQTQLNALTFVDENYGWAVGEDAVILHTQDGGLSWQKQFDDRTADSLGPLLDVNFVDKNTGLAVGVFNKIYRTTDGGKSWVNWMTHVDNLDEWHLFAIAATSKDNIYIASETGLIFYSTDAGQNFNALQTDHDGSFQNLLVRQSYAGKEQILLFGVGGKLFTSSNGLQNLAQVNTGTQTGLSAGTWLKDGSALIVGAEGVLLKSDVRLQNWQLDAVATGLPLSGAVNTQSATIYVGLGGIQRVTHQSELSSTQQP